MIDNKKYKIIELIEVNSNYFNEAMEIYSSSFPIEERQDIEKIKERIAKKQVKLFVYLIFNKVIGICLIWGFSNIKTYFIDYYAINQDVRSLGHGKRFLNELLKILDREYSIVLEVEKPDNEYDIIKIKRINFYNQFSFKSISGFYYIMPSFMGDQPLEMTLMYKHYQDISKLEITYLTSLVQEIHNNVYNDYEQIQKIISINKNIFYEIN